VARGGFVAGLLEDPSGLAEVVVPAVIPEAPAHKANDHPSRTGELAKSVAGERHAGQSIFTTSSSS